MINLTVRFHSAKEITLELDQAINEIDKLAFGGGDQNDSEVNKIEWSDHDWMALGYFGGKLVTQLCLLKREILVGGKPVLVAGVGGVATHPQWQKRGFATQLLRESETFMRTNICVPFGLLICAKATQPVYEQCKWHAVAKSVGYTQNGQYCTLATCVMVLHLKEQAWPNGFINLLGLPW